MPYASGSSTEKRLINLAIFVMLLVSESGDIEAQPTPLYAQLVPLARKLGRDAAQSAGNRTKEGRGPDFRGHGLKTTKMAEREGFEPSNEVDPRYAISSRARSTAPAPLQQAAAKKATTPAPTPRPRATTSRHHPLLGSAQWFSR
jgi:hypothetical protein